MRGFFPRKPALNRAPVALALFLALLLSLTPAFASNPDETRPTTPCLNHGQKWRIGCLQGGDFPIYRHHLLGAIGGLMDLGWIEKADLPSPDDMEDMAALWSWLCTRLKSATLQFVPDAFWSCRWDKQVRAQTREAILSRLKGKKDLDLMLAIGTWAGQDLASNDHSTPTFVLGVNDPVASRIIRSGNDSGYDHVHAWFDPKRDEEQIRLFFKSIGFKKLGVAYQDSLTGRSYGSMDVIEQLSKEKGFEVVPCHFTLDTSDTARSNAEFEQCLESLAPRVDAFYLSQNNLPPGALAHALAPLYTHKVPVFSKFAQDVPYGALMAISRSSYAYVGLFEASTIAKVLNGARPRDLPQLFEDPKKIALNLAVARQIGYDPADWVIELADEIFTEIKTTR